MYTNIKINQASNKKNPNNQLVFKKKTQSERQLLRITGWRVANPVPVDTIKDDPEKYFNSLTRIQRNVLDYMIFLKTRCSDVYISQGTLARKFGVTREYVNRLLGRFEKAGLLSRYYRHKKTCLYKISKFFLDPWIRKDLSKIFPALCFIPLFFLFPYLVSMPANSTYKALFIKITQTEDIYLNTRYLVKDSVLTRERARNMSNRLSVFEEFKQLPLTTHGKIMLSVYPDEVLRQGYQSLLKKTRVNSPYGFMRKYCEDYCSANSIDLDLAVKYKLFEQHPEAKQEPYVKPNSPVVRQPSYGYKQQQPIKREIEYTPDNKIVSHKKNYADDALFAVRKYEKNHPNGKCTDCPTCLNSVSLRYWMRATKPEELEQFFVRNPWAK